ncbi:LysR substrate-binding domain-containing protein [Pseudomonas sp. NPDC007930]|uniref:LysR family transcriptional regulator n=1 Tax=Pseudomonas sp. NPDC007930 TaxID=3364417 RepID=UPI0036E6CB41
MDLFQAMGVFVQVVERGSLTAAAQACGLSVTMVGNHLKALEQRLGVSLLNRTTRRQRLTEFGQAYYRQCQEVLGLVSASEQLAEQARSEPRGRLRLAAPQTLGAEQLAPALARYMQRCPQVEVELVLSNLKVDLLEDGFDAAIRLGPLGNPGVIARPLRDYTLTVCAAPEYLARRGTPRHPQALAEHDCLAFIYPAGDDWSEQSQLWLLGGERVNVAGRLRLNSSQGLYRAARAGMGIAMLPTALVAASVSDGSLVALLPDYPCPTRPMHLVYPADRYRSAKLRSFVDYLIELWGK